ncbi:MAG: hypothetical protein HYV09_39265 [Deltaproteobacteria bacterium]|nr:hypothetical protein [Deltaproteobacteria bacterium]
MRLPWHAVLLALLVLVSSTAPAQLLDPPTFVPKRSDRRVRFTAVDVGGGGAWLLDAKRASADVAVGVSHTAAIVRALTFAPGLRWGGGTGDDRRALVHRVSASVEVRWHPGGRDGYGFVRACPGVAWPHEGAVFALQASVGASWWFAAMDDDPTEAWPRLWLTPEVGFAWGAEALRGPFARLSLTLSL